LFDWITTPGTRHFNKAGHGEDDNDVCDRREAATDSYWDTLTFDPALSAMVGHVQPSTSTSRAPFGPYLWVRHGEITFVDERAAAPVARSERGSKAARKA